MIFRKIKFESIHIHFKTKFTHNSATRESTTTILVEIENENNEIGYGESCPRVYVTGETICSAEKFIRKCISEVSTISSLSELIKIQSKLAGEIDINPSAWCALEMALLDILAKENKKSVEKLLELNPTQFKIKNTAVLGVDSLMKMFFKLLVYKILGFTDFKLKLCGDPKKDLRSLKIVKIFSNKIRVDANNLFENVTSAIQYLKPLNDFIWAIEEPLTVGDFDGMNKLAQVLDLKIILDESFLNIKSIEKIDKFKNVYIPNIRISKMGGVLRTIELIRKLEEAQFSWILGSHVGEMSLLTRASIMISGNFHKGLIAQEGGFSTHLLSHDPFYPNLKLGMGARIKGFASVGKIGWGMLLIRKNEEKK